MERILKLLGKREPSASCSREESEEERKIWGRTAIEQFEESLLPELRQETISRVWKFFESKRKKSREFREEFQITDQPDNLYELLPIETYLFELYLTDRLLRTEKLITSRRLRIGIQLKDSSVYFNGRSRLKEPEKVDQEQRKIRGAMGLTKRSIGIILNEYAREIEADPNNREFRAWVLSFERLAQQLTVLFFDDDMSRIPRVIDLKRPDILNKRKAMFEKANLQLTS